MFKKRKKNIDLVNVSDESLHKLAKENTSIMNWMFIPLIICLSQSIIISTREGSEVDALAWAVLALLSLLVIASLHVGRGVALIRLEIRSNKGRG